VALALVARGLLALPPDGGAPEIARALRVLVDGHGGSELPRFLRHGPLELDVDRRTARWNDATLDLTKLQFRLLVALVTADGALVSRADLHRALYGTAPIDDGERVVAHVRRVRDKIEPQPSRPRFLLTVRGEGFRLADAF
jgi:DNA-binding response OmpR family regulator